MKDVFEILVVGDIHKDALTLLGKQGNITTITNDLYLSTKSFPSTNVLVIRTFSPLQPKDVAKFPQLKYVISCSVGLDNIDIAELTKHKVTLINCLGTNANSVAEHALYLIFALLRQDSQRPFAELKGKTVGLVGFGAIGKILARKLKGCEVNVVAYDVVPQDVTLLQELNVAMVSLPTLLAKSDIFSIHVPLLEHTRNLCNKEFFSQIKEHAFFINTSRAEVVDETALLWAIKEKKLRGVGLDVFSEDLRKKLTGNIVLTNHVAAQGEDSFREQCVKPVEEFVKVLGRAHN
ncbi:hypothetical protein HYV86_07415 [Candidatus Woesearchaeota archaeon]|nr:hypothetical protein [Candidatus Woesearchaeota archaeon]